MIIKTVMDSSFLGIWARSMTRSVVMMMTMVVAVVDVVVMMMMMMMIILRDSSSVCKIYDKVTVNGDNDGGQ